MHTQKKVCGKELLVWKPIDNILTTSFVPVYIDTFLFSLFQKNESFLYVDTINFKLSIFTPNEMICNHTNKSNIYDFF